MKHIDLIDMEDVNQVVLRITIVPFDDRYYKLIVEGWNKTYLVKKEDLENLKRV